MGKFGEKFKNVGKDFGRDVGRKVQSRGKGWYNDPYKHGLASKGFKVSMLDEDLRKIKKEGDLPQRLKLYKVRNTLRKLRENAKERLRKEKLSQEMKDTQRAKIEFYDRVDSWLLSLDQKTMDTNKYLYKTRKIKDELLDDIKDKNTKYNYKAVPSKIKKRM